MNQKFLMAMLMLAGAASAFAGDATPAKSDSDVAGIDAAKLWAQTCSQCHNMSPVKSYSPAEWGVIVHHMRVRANLTGSEARAIAAFLQSSGN
jgi:mono/diheme cytochrome c family protein